MNGRSIPGFYYDQEKQKYFRILPGHRLADNSKYASSVVQKEERARKRHARESKHHERRLAKQPSLAGTLRLGGVNGSIMMREIGRRTASQVLVDSSCGFASRLALSVAVRNDSVESQLREIVGAYPMLNEHGILLELGNFSLWHASWDHLTMDQHFEPGQAHLSSAQLLAGRKYYQYPQQGTSTQLHCIGLQFHERRPGSQLYYHYKESGTTDARTFAGFISAAKLDMPNWLADVNILNQHRIAVLPVGQLVCLDAAAGSLEVLNLKKEANFVDWLGHNVMIAGQNKGVRLWDVRTQDSLTRIHHGRRITGITGIRDSLSNQILVTDNHQVKLYDLRMVSKNRSRHAIAFPGVHEGPRSLTSIGPTGLLAAHLDNALQVLSLTQGRKVASYQIPKQSSSLPTQLAWHEDARGSPYIQMCVNDAILRWSLHSRDHESDD